ncbi:MAG: nucleotide exchange factor GrpE [Polyangiaceae bacterium]|nr:nucleotide exchange factor GrpE [Polyangiaceae bacterium]
MTDTSATDLDTTTSDAEGAPQEAQPDPLEVARAEQARLKDQLLRVAADFDNFRKRSRRDIMDAERKVREDQLRDLLPVFDNLERAAAHAGSATDVKALLDGLQMVMRQFQDALSKLGVERLVGVGQAFDPALHEAIQHIETAEYPPGVVAAEAQAGYRMNDRVIRPALVVVAKAPVSAPAQTSESDA